MSDPEHVPLGWICPRCGHVWAPDVRECTCEPEPDVVLVAALPAAALPAAVWYETRVEYA